MEARAQTIVQLFNQLRSHGYDAEDLQLVRRAYALMVPLCTCQYRSSGRTLIDHAVGVASLLAALGVPAPLVVAGLVHLAYLHGDFGTWRKRVLESKRSLVRTAVGSVVEDYVHRYTRLDWSVAGIAALCDRLPQLDAFERDVVLMRLADQLDIYGGQDALYCDNARRRRAYARDVGTAVAALADGLGAAPLAAALTRAFDGVRDATVAAELEHPAWKDAMIVPRSYRIRRPIALYRAARSTVYRLAGR